MSEKLSSKLRRKPVGKRKDKKSDINWQNIIVLPVWVLVSFLSSAVLVSALLWALGLFGISVEQLLRPSVFNMVTASAVYVLSIVIVISVPYKLLRYKTSLADVGLTRLMTWTDIGLAPLTFLVYTFVLAAALGVLVALFPAFPVNQPQDVGFDLFGSRLDNIIAFLTLVVLAPLAEEALFRGYLYGKLKTYAPAIWAAVITSVLFGIVHFQWNVGIDVFVLSMFLCGLRSLTGSIWAGVLTHSLKNAVAYFILINPLLFGG